MEISIKLLTISNTLCSCSTCYMYYYFIICNIYKIITTNPGMFPRFAKFKNMLCI